MKNDGKKKPGQITGKPVQQDSGGASTNGSGWPGGGGVGGGGGAAKPRRLGRGLSSLIGSPVVVSANAGKLAAAKAPTAINARPAAEGVVEPKPIAASQDGATRPVSQSLNGATRPVSQPLSESARPHSHVDERTHEAGIRAADEPRGERLIEADVRSLVPSKYQPRKKFDEASLAELAASIKSAGVVQPIVVRPVGGGSSAYEIIAGERRWRAAQLAGLATVPARVCEVGEEQAAEWALIENLQRTDLGAMERAWALRGLCEKFGLTHAQAGEKVGLDRSSVTNLVRLTELEHEIATYLEEAQLSLGHGKALLGMTPGPARVSLAKKAAEESWSVRRLEAEAAKRSQAIKAGELTPAETPGGPEQDPRRASLLELEQQLSTHLGTRARLRTSRDGSRGRLIVEFYDLDHFDGLMSKMGFVLSS